MPVNLQHLQRAVNATKTEQEHFQSPCAVSGIQNNFNPTRNSESARRNAPDSVHGGELRDIKCKTGQPTTHYPVADSTGDGGCGVACSGRLDDAFHFRTHVAAARASGTAVGSQREAGWGQGPGACWNVAPLSAGYSSQLAVGAWMPCPPRTCTSRAR